MIYLSKVKLDGAEIESVVSVLKSGQLAQGKKVEEFERKIASLTGAKYTVAVTSGTAALHTAVHSAGINAGDEVITTPFTFGATANSILMAGAKPVFADIEENSFNLDPKRVEAAVTRKTRAIIAVNLFGQPADFQEINRIARKHGLIVIEDAAQSIFADYKGKKSGNLGDLGTFSLYATKNITSGEGGVITSNSKTFYDHARLFRHHGQHPEKRYEYINLGFNYRMTDIIAALAVEQVKKIRKITTARQTIAGRYNRAFRNLSGVITPSVLPNRSHVYHQYVLRITGQQKRSRTAFRKFLEKAGIQTAVHYPKPLYEFAYLRGSAKKELFPVTEKIRSQIVSIPVHPHLTEAEIQHIIKTVSAFSYV